jgi:hypothetical protein
MEKMEYLERMKRSIEALNKFHQIEVLRILSKHSCKLNENKSGVYVNLTFLTDETVQELEKYLEYTKDQEDTLTTTEYQKEEFKTTFFDKKADKDIATMSYNHATR